MSLSTDLLSNLADHVKQNAKSTSKYPFAASELDNRITKMRHPLSSDRRHKAEVGELCLSYFPVAKVNSTNLFE